MTGGGDGTEVCGELPVSDDTCYRAMDWLHDIRERLEVGVFHQIANLLNLDVDLLFFDTTSTYFELEDPDQPVRRDEQGHLLRDHAGEKDGAGEKDEQGNSIGFRTYGKSKDSRDDLPQIVIGMAVTRDGIPVRVWCWPGNTNDSALGPWADPAPAEGIERRRTRLLAPVHMSGAQSSRDA